MSPQKNKPCTVLVRPRLYIGDGITIGPVQADAYAELQQILPKPID